jgi:hypothetical protein
MSSLRLGVFEREIDFIPSVPAFLISIFYSICPIIRTAPSPMHSGTGHKNVSSVE